MATPRPSVAWPVNGMRSPTFQVSVAAGVSMTGRGRESSTSTSRLAVPLIPPGSVTRRRTVCVPEVVKVTEGLAAVESLKSPSLLRSQA